MKKQVFAVMGILLLLAPIALNAQRGGGWGRNSKYCNQYDVQNVKEFKGEVIKIDQFVPGKGMGQGYEIIVRTGSGEKTVHLGPVSYVQAQELKLQVGDRIEITGSEINFNGAMVIMAGEIERNGEKLRLRNEQGQPMWW